MHVLENGLVYPTAHQQEGEDEKDEEEGLIHGCLFFLGNRFSNF